MSDELREHLQPACETVLRTSTICCGICCTVQVNGRTYVTEATSASDFAFVRFGWRPRGRHHEQRANSSGNGETQTPPPKP